MKVTAKIHSKIVAKVPNKIQESYPWDDTPPVPPVPGIAMLMPDGTPMLTPDGNPMYGPTQ